MACAPGLLAYIFISEKKLPTLSSPPPLPATVVSPFAVDPLSLVRAVEAFSTF